MKIQYAVLAGREREFEDFLGYFRYSPEDRNKFVCVVPGSLSRNLHGLRFHDYFVIGTFSTTGTLREREEALHRVFYNLTVKMLEYYRNNPKKH